MIKHQSSELPSFSIVIPSHCCADLLTECLQSVTAHAPTNTEIVVVDDASPGAMISRTVEQFATVRVIRLESQSGFCVAVNEGTRATSGDIVEVLNDDTKVSPGWAEPILQRFRQPKLAAVAPLVLYSPLEKDPIIDSAGDSYFPGGVARKIHHGRRWSTVKLQAGPVFGASGSSAFYRRSALEAVGGFDENFGAYFEDVELSYRLRAAGYRIEFEPSSIVHHHVGASYGRVPDDALLEQQARNEERLFWRCTPWHLWWCAIPLHLLVLMGKAWKRWREGRLAPFLRGKRACFQDFL